MSYKQNLHTHSTFCDGENTPEELVIEAIARGFDSIGFSTHSYVPCSGIGSLEALERYKQEILRLKNAYRDQIKIFLGLEYDIYSDHGPEGYEYTIASVHCLKLNGVCYDFDQKLEGTLQFLNTHFQGNGTVFARNYYEMVASIPKYGRFDILGHFDLITKNNEKGNFLNVHDPVYLGYAKDAIHALKGKIPLFEVNTGCIGRGYRTTPYPQTELLKEFKDCGFGAVITSDCHKKEYLDCNFEDAKQLLQSVGYNTIYVLTEQGFQEIPID